jgi:DNA-binding SARP family transcriptional activator
MATLSIRLLGGFEMERNGAILAPPATPKSRSLLAYMLLNRGRLTHRETLCATLWPDESEAVARKGLRTALWRIRCALGEDGNEAPYLYADAYQLGFRGIASVWVDVWEFEEIASALDAKPDEALGPADGDALARAAGLYRGDCAPGVYDDWLTSEQSRLHHTYIRLLERLAAFHARHERWPQAIGWAERALASDALREHLHRIVMACHLSMGDRPSALRQYARCEAVLRRELGINPMADTRALLDRIEDASGDAPPEKRASRPPSQRPRKPRPAPEPEDRQATSRAAHARSGRADDRRRSQLVS